MLRKKMERITFPNGDKKKILVPERPCSHATGACGFSVILIPLRSDSKTAMREYNIVTKQMTSTIVPHSLQENGGGRFMSYNIVTIERIINPCLWKRFREKRKQISKEVGGANEKMLFHGTPVAQTIVKYGFDRKKANPTGMFGSRIYFAEHSSKSNQYVYGYLGGNGCPRHMNTNCYDCPRQVLLCRVLLGKTIIKVSADKHNDTPPGHHSLTAVPSPGGLRYPEYAVDHEDQVYPNYLITYKIVP